ncbi:TetR/AcrR family transcriptional regulator [Shouchella patagoniensis]|uniref:TetR/AcrR family transcriptional regulator n=1 Tax=Shouchella patagoniensis TaxID=228576 RepID=UPI0014740F6F|nr:TetR/AcrR family transcriptional regulator [Shouchella patagoniensis]
MKQSDIMRVAFHLFSEKGYSATSVQEIVAQCKISKATFYKHFSSKKELFFQLLDYRHFLFDSEEQAIEESTLEAKEKFLKKTKLYMRSLFVNRKIYHLIPFVMEQEEFRELEKPMRDFKIKSYHRLKQNLMGAYTKVEPVHIWDLVLLYDAAVKEFVEVGSYNENELDLNHAAQSIVSYMDLLLKKGELDEPLLSSRLMEEFDQYKRTAQDEVPAEAATTRFLKLLEEQIEEVPLAGTEREALRANLALLKEEIEQEAPRWELVKALLLVFEQRDEFVITVEQIKKCIG